MGLFCDFLVRPCGRRRAAPGGRMRLARHDGTKSRDRHPEERSAAQLRRWLARVSKGDGPVAHILRGSPKTASTSRVNALAFIPGMTASLSSAPTLLKTFRSLCSPK